MSWLEDMKHKFELKESTEKAKRVVNEKEHLERLEQATKKLNEFLDTTIRSLDGKTTKDGCVLKLVVNGNKASLYKNNDVICMFHFYHEAYYNQIDGLRDFSGWNFKPYMNCNNGWEWIDEEKLAKHLLRHIEGTT